MACVLTRSHTSANRDNRAASSLAYNVNGSTVNRTYLNASGTNDWIRLVFSPTATPGIFGEPSHFHAGMLFIVTLTDYVILVLLAFGVT